MSESLATALVATVLLAGVFVQPWPREVLDERKRGFRSFVSFAAGLSLAYVFVDLLPELSGLGDELLEEEAVALPFPEYVAYLAALFGFVLFYGLERLVRWHHPDAKRERAGPVDQVRAAVVGEGTAARAVEREVTVSVGEDEEEEAHEAEERTDYRIKLIALGAYAALILYLMTAGIREGSEEGLVAYVIAMIFHFLAMRHGLRYEFPGAYMHSGRWWMAGLCVLGAGLGLITELSIGAEVLLLGFLGGMLIMNTTVMEMPSEKEGRFGMFALGATVYAALLMIA
jgi:hypothetical protein